MSAGPASNSHCIWISRRFTTRRLLSWESGIYGVDRDVECGELFAADAGAGPDTATEFARRLMRPVGDRAPAESRSAASGVDSRIARFIVSVDRIER